MYMEKFSRFFPDQETIDDWCATWAEGLAGITGDEMKYGLEILARQHEWPPTLMEFRACCKAAPAPHFPRIEAPKHGVTPHAQACMAEIARILAKPRRIDSWWKEVLELERQGKPTSVAAHLKAKEAEKLFRDNPLLECEGR